MTLLPSIFPDGRRAALSLTYDDGVAQHLDVVMPDLEAHGLRGTFYVNTHQPPAAPWNTRRDEWRAAAGRGHEIGNHTQYHPCGKHFSFVKPNFSLEAYSLARMEAELLAASRDLDEAVGPAPVRTFAYTCGEEYVGPDHTSIRPMADRLFLASRAGRDELADPMTVDLASVPSFITNRSTTAGHLRALIDRAIERGHWLVLMIHGVNGGHPTLDIPRDVHRAALRHAVDRADAIWCDTFINVASHVRQATNRPWRRTGT